MKIFKICTSLTLTLLFLSFAYSQLDPVAKVIRTVLKLANYNLNEMP